MQPKTLGQKGKGQKKSFWEKLELARWISLHLTQVTFFIFMFLVSFFSLFAQSPILSPSKNVTMYCLPVRAILLLDEIEDYEKKDVHVEGPRGAMSSFNTLKRPAPKSFWVRGGSYSVPPYQSHTIFA